MQFWDKSSITRMQPRFNRFPGRIQSGRPEPGSAVLGLSVIEEEGPADCPEYLSRSDL